MPSQNRQNTARYPSDCRQPTGTNLLRHRPDKQNKGDVYFVRPGEMCDVTDHVITAKVFTLLDACQFVTITKAKRTGVSDPTGVTTRHRQSICRVSTGDQSMTMAKFVSAGHRVPAGQPRDTCRPMPARLLNPAGACRGYIPDGHRQDSSPTPWKRRSASSSEAGHEARMATQVPRAPDTGQQKGKQPAVGGQRQHAQPVLGGQRQQPQPTGSQAAAQPQAGGSGGTAQGGGPPVQPQPGLQAQAAAAQGAGSSGSQPQPAPVAPGGQGQSTTTQGMRTSQSQPQLAGAAPGQPAVTLSDPGPCAAQPAPRAGPSQAPKEPQQELMTLRKELEEMKETVSRIQKGRTTAELQDEVVQYARRAWAAFDPQRAVALLQTLVTQARRENHQKAREFAIIAEQLTPHAEEPYFKDLIVNQLGSQLDKQISKDIAAFAKLHAKSQAGPSSAYRGRRYTGTQQFRPRPYYQPRRGRGRGRGGPRPEDNCEEKHPVDHRHAYMEHLLAKETWVTRTRDGKTIIPPPVEELTRYIEKDHYHTKCDDKSGYDHIMLSESSKALVGFQWGGVWYATASLPYGWRCSAEMFAAIAKAQKEGGKITIEKGVQKELEYWRFLDGWKGHMTWRKEKHDVIKLASDASGFKWGGSVTTDEGEVQMGDYWQGKETEEHISIKETEALTKVLIAMEQHVRNKRVEAWVDNKNLISAWENQGSRSLALTRAVVRLWETVIGYNIDLMLTYVPSKDNPADEPSRRLSASDAKLHSKVFARIDKELGGQQGFDEILVANIMGQGIHGCQGGTSRTTSVTLPVSQSDVENTSDNLGPHGRGGEWDERLGLGNPAASPIVKEYLKAVTGEQLQQGITPQQAKPLFLPKIIKVCQYIVQQIETEKSPIKLFIRARDQAIFKAVFFAGDRGLVKKM
ncbi:hypothetical protein Bbelb_160320 [Branchiostoma belcheri]|nr:hypothetical protein Bbelb_160320 [Branchiostoma belcheri]